jgi:predicted acetyltransferase
MFDIPGITLRAATADDLDQIVQLDRLAFAPTKTNATIAQDWYSEGLNLPGRQLWLAVEEHTGVGVACYCQIDLEINFLGKILPALGIAGVAVAPHRRGQQLARLMLEQALATAQSRHFPLTMLYPFQHGFYRQLGWAWVSQTHQYRVSTRHLPLYAERSGIIPYHPQHELALKATYQQAARQHNGWLQRSDQKWRDYLKFDDDECYLYQADGQILGYVFGKFTYLDGPQKLLAVNVLEWVALNNAAYRGILGFLASLRDQVATVIWNTDPTDPLPHLLQEQRCDPRLAEASFDFGLVHRLGAIGGGFMWRLVDLAVALPLRPIAPGSPFTVTWQISDDSLGDRILTVEFAQGRMQIVDQPVPAVLKISIAHLTVLFAGTRTATDLARTGEIEFTGDQAILLALDQAWQTTAPFCWDFF